MSVRYLSCGDTAFTVEFGNEISPQINGQVMALHAAIGAAKAAGKLEGVVETVPTMRSLMVIVERVARSQASVLITGESGSGKELIARALHHHSMRSHKPHNWCWPQHHYLPAAAKGSRYPIITPMIYCTRKLLDTADILRGAIYVKYNDPERKT